MRNERGTTLMMVLIATMVSGILLLAVLALLTLQNKSQKNVEIQSDLIDLRNYVAMNTDCTRSVVPRPSACDVGGPIDLLARDGSLLVSGNPDSYTLIGGKYFLRSSCANCPGCANGKKVLVEFMIGRMGALGPEPLRNPLTKRVANWQDLFREVPFGCLIPSA